MSWSVTAAASSLTFNANSTSVRSRSSGTAFAPSATNCLTLPSSVFKPWFRIVQKAAVQYGQPLALDTANPTCWISSMLSSPICQRTLVAPSFALKNSGKFISTWKWLGTEPSICVTQSKISRTTGSSTLSGLTIFTRAIIPLSLTPWRQGLARSLSGRNSRNLLDHLVGLPWVEPPRRVVRRIVEPVCDLASQGRNLARSAHQLQDLRLRRDQQRVRPPDHPLRVVPEDVEGLLHPMGIERLVAALSNPFQVDAGRLAGGVRTLPGNGIVGGNHVRHAECQTARGQLADRRADRRRESAHQDSIVVGQFDVSAAFPFERHEGVQNPFALGQMFFRSLHIIPAVHWAAGNAFKHHDLAGPGGGQRWEDEVFTHSRHQVE